MRIILVTGGRAYDDRHAVFCALTLRRPDLVVHGGAKTWRADLKEWTGADHYAGEWADQHDVPQLKAPYVRSKGKAGGPIRNRWMINFLRYLLNGNPLLYEISVLAFPGCTGTEGTITMAQNAGLSVERFDPAAQEDEEL